MALSEAAILPVVDVETELGIATGTEPRLEGWIEDASAMIADFLDRTLQRSDVIVEQCGGDGTPYLVLDRPPVLSVATITHSSFAVDSLSYELQDGSAGALFFRGMTIDDDYQATNDVSASRLENTARRLYTVTYAGGWVTPRQAATGGTFAGQPVTLPRAIRRACVELVQYIRARVGTDAGVASESMLSYSVSYRDDDGDEDGSGISKSIRAKLLGYKLDRV